MSEDIAICDRFYLSPDGAGGAERAAESVDVVAPVEEPVEVAAAAEVPPAAEVKAE